MTIEEFIRRETPLIKNQAKLAIQMLGDDILYGFEDLITEAQIYLCIRFHKVDFTKTENQIHQWVKIIVGNFYRDLYKKKKRQISVDDTIDLLTAEFSSDNLAPEFCVDFKNVVDDIFKSLAPKYRRIFKSALKWGRQSYKEIADETGYAESTVRVRLSHIFKNNSKQFDVLRSYIR
jgi:RNA polymerase sigma factor (sigma-70 family)